MTFDLKSFESWITDLREKVIEDEYGYEPGEFTVYPEQWRPLFDEGLTPEQAFRRALDAFAEEREERERLQAENWARIQAADAAYLSKLSGDDR